MISETGRPATKPSALSRIECMSSALSLPPARNFACCHTKRARSRVVKYLRAASPRANQNSDAPIIIVLSTSKNAAADGSASTAGGPVTSAAAADASPATWARTPGSGATAARRPRDGSSGTAPPQLSRSTPGRRRTAADPNRRGGAAPPQGMAAGQQLPTRIGPRQMLTNGGLVLGEEPPLEAAPAPFELPGSDTETDGSGTGTGTG